MTDDSRNPDDRGTGDSVSRRGENIGDHDGKEAGRYDTDRRGPTGRPAGKSTSRDSTSVDPDDSEPGSGGVSGR